MSAQLDALNAAVASLGPKVDQLLAALQSQPDPAAVQAAADAIAGISAKIDQAIAALTPKPPA